MVENVLEWENCIYGLPANSGGEMTLLLTERGLHETYTCRNNEVIRLGAYPKETIKVCGKLKDIAKLHKIMISGAPSEEDVKKLEDELDRALAGCKLCRYRTPPNLTKK